tara:strand:+ start:4256 stop:4504 length:249 start_codon:yes stop_codon:yes gene_type:complete
MKKFKQLEKKCPDGIPFSKCKEYLEKQKKKTKRIKHSPSKKREKKPKKKSLKQKIPPKGVIIRKNNILYKSNGKSLQPLVNK